MSYDERRDNVKKLRTPRLRGKEQSLSEIAIALALYGTPRECAETWAQLEIQVTVQLRCVRLSASIVSRQSLARSVKGYIHGPSERGTIRSIEVRSP